MIDIYRKRKEKKKERKRKEGGRKEPKPSLLYFILRDVHGIRGHNFTSFLSFLVSTKP